MISPRLRIFKEQVELMKGYFGEYYHIDVGSQQVQRRPLSTQRLQSFLGGVGLGASLLHDSMNPKTTPLSAEATIYFVFSALVGTPLTTSAKFAVVGWSPLTGRFNDALASSHFAINGKKCGVDALALTGVSATWQVLLINDDHVQFVPAPVESSPSISSYTQHLEATWGRDYSFGVIGRAGENQVPYATINFSGRHAGRGGFGALLGSKRIKALGVKGTRKVLVANPRDVVRKAQDWVKRSLAESTSKYRELGTIANLTTFNRLNALPTRNFQLGHFQATSALDLSRLLIESADQAAGQSNHSSSSDSPLHQSCAACTIGCEKVFQSRSGRVRMEYESLFALGSLCGITDQETVLQATHLCDELGLDSISTGGSLAFAMEAFEKQLLPKTASSSSDWPRFGNATTLLRCITAIAHRQGPGEFLALGTRGMAAALGGAAHELAIHIKGMEMPGYEPRTLQAMALGLAVNARGADHNRSGAYQADFSTGVDRLAMDERSVRAVIDLENRSALIDSLILCKFLRGIFTDFYGETAEVLSLVTGLNYSAESLENYARGIINQKKLFNMKAGWTKEEDTLPRRFFQEVLPAGNAPGGIIDEQQFLKLRGQYYQERGWDDEGRCPI